MAYGGSVGPYRIGKIYCGFCGEYRHYGIDVVTSELGRLICTECGLQARPRGRYWIRYAKEEEKPHRY